MLKSKQRFEDDPKNRQDWEIYPPPPSPSWPLPPPDELARRKEKEKRREADPIAAVGSDFDINHFKIPEKHPVCSRYSMCKRTFT
jgi:AMP deaminase